MGSSRLPGKTLCQLGDKSLLEHIIARASQATRVDAIIIATTLSSQDNPIADLCEDLNIPCFRGSEYDVLDRMYHASQYYELDNIVRLTADCPLIDPAIIDNAISHYFSADWDYTSNTIYRTYPDGMDVEVFSALALQKAWSSATVPSDREHVTPFIINSGLFHTKNFSHEMNLSHYKLSVDTEQDLKSIRNLYQKIKEHSIDYGLTIILNALNSSHSLKTLISQGVTNDGYYRSLLKNPPVEQSPKNINISLSLKEKAEQLIPGVTQTFSKGPSQFVQGVSPVFIERGSGSHVWDVDGNEYIDYVLALGPIILGQNFPSVTEAVMNQIQKGTLFSLPHPIEIELAQILVDLIPSAEMVRFGKNGSDATSGAVRVSRAYTGREMVACCGYHGWQDWYVGTTTRSLGVPTTTKELTASFTYNDISSLENIFKMYPDQIACVILEPIGVEEPHDDFLGKVRDLTHHNDAILIFDEVITGFRLDIGGAQSYFGVYPDLTCLGKALANGYPLSAIAGRRDIMKLFDDIFFSFTYGGETLSLAASVATIQTIQNQNVINHLWEQGRKLRDGINIMSAEFDLSKLIKCKGLAPRSVITFKDVQGSDDLALKSLFQQECLKRGILTAGYHNVCYSHSNQDIEYTLQVYRSVLEIISVAIKEGDINRKLEGEIIQPVFRDI